MADRYCAAIDAGDREKWERFFADNIVIMPPGKAVIRGREAACSFGGQMFEQFTIHETIVYDEIHVDDDWASGQFHYTLDLSPKKGGATQTEHGKAVAWLKRSGDSWVFTHWIWNQDPSRV
jgi:ketosteroid isomerase-like protein